MASRNGGIPPLPLPKIHLGRPPRYLFIQAQSVLSRPLAILRNSQFLVWPEAFLFPFTSGFEGSQEMVLPLAVVRDSPCISTPCSFRT